MFFLCKPKNYQLINIFVTLFWDTYMGIVHLHCFQSLYTTTSPVVDILTHKTKAVQLPFTSSAPVQFITSLHVCVFYFQASLSYTI